jgi:hypothetical protein
MNSNIKVKKYEVRIAIPDGDLIYTGTVDQIAEYLGVNNQSVYRTIKKGSMHDRKYNIVEPGSNKPLAYLQEYAVYDTQDNDLNVFIGLRDDVMKFLDIKSPTTLFSSITNKTRVKLRYLVEKI